MNDNEGLPEGQQLPPGAEHAPLSSGEIMTMLMLDEYRRKNDIPDDSEVEESHLQVAKAAAEVAIAAGMCVMDMVDSEKTVNYAKVVNGSTDEVSAVVMVGAADEKLVKTIEALYYAFNPSRDTPNR